MKLVGWVALLVPVSLLTSVQACSSGGSTTGVPASSSCLLAPADGEDPFSTNGASGKFVSIDEACKAFTCALNARAADLQCAFDKPPSCPAAIADGFPGKCIDQIDQGTVDNCRKRISTYQLCARFSDKPCAFVGRECGSPKDAGTDTSPADTGSDASSDGGG